MGYYRVDDDPVADYLFPRPDTLYGVSKAAGESLCSLYHDRYGLEAISSSNRVVSRATD